MHCLYYTDWSVLFNRQEPASTGHSESYTQLVTGEIVIAQSAASSELVDVAECDKMWLITF